jgi:streptogramin lyase
MPTLNRPSDVAVAKDGSLYIADAGNYRIRRIDPAGIITTIAGTGVDGYTGDGGPATQAQISNVLSLAVGPDGSIYFNQGYQVVRRIAPDGTISLYAGGGSQDADEVPATQTSTSPYGIAAGDDGSLYIYHARALVEVSKCLELQRQ